MPSTTTTRERLAGNLVRPHTWWRWVAPLLLVLFSLVYVGYQVPQHHQFSPIDEYVYADYLAKVPTQLVVHRGEQVGEYARNLISCIGVQNYGPYGQSCNVGTHTGNNALYPYNGGTAADLYTPVFFAITWVVAAPLTFTGISLLDAARLTGGLWLAGGLVLLYFFLLRLRVHRATALGASLALLAAPSIYWANTFLSTDAPSVTVGAGLLWATAYFLQTGRKGWLIAAIGMFGVAMKLQNIAAVGVVFLILIAHAIASERTQSSSTKQNLLRALRTSKVRIAFIAAFGSVAIEGIWVVIRALIAYGPAPDQGVATTLTWKLLLQEAVKFLGGAGSFGASPSLIRLAIGTVISWICIAGVLGVTARSRYPDFDALLSRSSLIMALLVGPVLALANNLVAGMYFDLPSRYGLSLVPAFIACGALLVRERTRLAPYIAVLGAAGATGAILPH